jgi:hypothetical protein
MSMNCNLNLNIFLRVHVNALIYIMQPWVVENQRCQIPNRGWLFATQGEKLSHKSYTIYLNSTSKFCRQDYGDLLHLKSCDMMYFHVINFTSTSDVLYVDSTANGKHACVSYKNIS